MALRHSTPFPAMRLVACIRTTGAHVPLLIEPRIALLPLVTALAAAGLAIRHDHQRNALMVVPLDPRRA